MVVLSYDSAKRSLLVMALYLVITSLIIKGLGFVIELNLAQAFSSLGSITNIADFNLDLPKFDISTLSFESAKSFILDKLNELVQMLLPAALGVVNITSLSGSAPTILHMDKTMMVVKV
ncbi:hypothetical protein BME96_19060 (plasmid) [Virgibacillus halodenitrificans]|uniref:Uncharacterized protein n=1 Tax=Virgibacillus halodenitrificans TaxID=1482 RepID=A0AAC9J809_VIRHA|nr:hypothetical protein [Virgibacillus halodenitrificans]APC50384.1 hypothetical protein BME96_19060 [Virgibacillus halodenitrificans]CDQ37698.1 hypothetical protein BN993_07260 [Virgibacillus halodenitrificans]